MNATMCRVRARGGMLVVAAAVALASTGCTTSGLPDPFRGALSKAQVVSDRVDCDPAPDLCTRYVVLRPAGISTNELMTVIEDRLQSSLHWRPTRYPDVVDADMGAGFDGPKPHSPSGFVNTTVQELHYWNRVGLTTGTPPHPAMLAVKRAMESTPGGVVVAISRG